MTVRTKAASSNTRPAGGNAAAMADRFTAATNDQSILSKASAVKIGYWNDAMLLDIVPRVKKQRRPPLIHMGYWLRHKSVSHIYKSFLECLPSGQPFNVINLGSGFDTFTIHAFYDHCKSQDDAVNKGHFIDIDFPSVIQEKKTLMENAPSVPAELTTSQKSRYLLHGQDISHVSRLSGYMEDQGVNMNLPTFVLCEVVMPYMSDADSQALKTWISVSFSKAVLCFFEPISFGSEREADPFGDAMLDHYRNAVHSPLHTTARYVGVMKQRRRFLKAGFGNVAFALGPQVLDSWFAKQDVVDVGVLEPFDEFEVWRVYLRHCIIGFASCDQSEDLFEKMVKHVAKDHPNDAFCTGPFARRDQMDVDVENVDPNKANQTPEKDSIVDAGLEESILSNVGNSDSFPGTWSLCQIPWITVKRSGACSAVSWNGEYLFTIGGVEVGGNRLDTIMVSQTGNVSTSREFASSHHHLVYSTAVTFMKPNGVLVFGGRSSPKKASNSVIFISADPGSLGKETIFYVSHDGKQEGPPKRYRHSANRIEVDGEERMIVFGGRTEDGAPLNDVWTFSPNSATWQQLICSEGSGPSPRHSHASEVNNNVLYVYGGLDAKSQVLGDCWMFVPEFCEWRKMGDLQPIFGHRMISIDRDFVFGDRMWAIVGGVRKDGSTVQRPFIIRKARNPPMPEHVEVYEENPTFSGSQYKTCKNEEWFSFGAAICSHTPSPDPNGDTHIYCCGGGGGLFSFGHCFNTTVSKMTIRLRPKPATRSSRRSDVDA